MINVVTKSGSNQLHGTGFYFIRDSAFGATQPLNNVFLDPSSPLTTNAISENGEQQVFTETGAVSLASTFSWRLISHLRAQFSRDLQQSSTNATAPLTEVRSFIDTVCTSAIPSASKASGIPGKLGEMRCSPGSITISPRRPEESTFST